MKFEIIKLSRANAEVVEAYLYYERISGGLGERFLQEIEDELGYISKNPELIQKSYRNFRQIYLKSFPFALIFDIQNQMLVVYSVFNTHQNPTKKP